MLDGPGAEVVEVSLPAASPYALAAYYLILPSEASSNLAKFDAMRYGLRVGEDDGDPTIEQVMAATRDAGFGDEVKRRIILGTYALSAGYYDAYYGSAQKVRTLIQRDFAAAFEPGRRARLADRADDGVQARREARRPAGDVPQRRRDHPGEPRRRPRHVAAERPRAEDGLPVGLQILAPAMADDRLYRVGAALEAALAATGGARPLLDGGCRRCDGATTTTDGHQVLRLRRGHRGLRPRARPRGARRAQHRDEDVLRLPDRVRRRAQHPGVPGLPRPARRAAGRQRDGRRVGDPDRPGAQLRDRRRGAASPGRTTSTRTCRRTSRSRSTTSRSRSTATSTSTSSSTTARPSGSRSSAPTWRRTPASHRTSAARPAASTAPTTRSSTTTAPASRSSRSSPSRSTGTGRVRARGRPRLRRRAARPAARARRLRRADGAGLAALRREPLAAPDAGVAARHPHRDQERQLAALGRARGPLRDRRGRPRCSTAGGTHRAGDPALARGHRHHDLRAGEKSDAEDYRYFPEPDLVPVAPSREWVEELRATLPEPRPCASAAAAGRRGASPTSRCATSSTPARSTLVEATVAAGAAPAAARKWWTGELARVANERGVELAELPITPADVARVAGARRRRARSTTSWPARCSRACSPARATPDEVVASRGLAVVSDDGALARGHRRGDRRAPRRRRQDPRRQGAAAGAIVGAVMKAMRGQADAGRVRELVLERLGVTEE